MPSAVNHEPAQRTYRLAQCKHTISTFFSKRILQVTLTYDLAVEMTNIFSVHTQKSTSSPTGFVISTYYVISPLMGHIFLNCQVTSGDKILFNNMV
jgi:hypothetical protein